MLKKKIRKTDKPEARSTINEEIIIQLSDQKNYIDRINLDIEGCEQKIKNLEYQLSEAMHQIENLTKTKEMNTDSMVPEFDDLDFMNTDEFEKYLENSIGFDVLNEDLPKNITKAEDLDKRKKLFIKSLSIRNQGPIFILGVPKSGGSWLSYVLQDCTGFLKAKKRSIKECDRLTDYPWNFLFYHFSDMVALTGESLEKYIKKPAIIHAHIAPTKENIALIKKSKIKYVFLYRDIRDIMVSLYHHLQVRSRRYGQLLPELSLEEGLEVVLKDFLKPLKSFIEGWIGNNDNSRCLHIKYEDMVKDNKNVISRILEFYNIEYEEARIHDIIEKYTFSVSDTNDAAMKEHAFSAFKWRKGSPGDWVNHFNETHKNLIKETAGSLLIELGYEKDNSW